MATHRAKAKQLLINYFSVFAYKMKLELDNDNRAEIEDIVDEIVLAVIEEISLQKYAKNEDFVQ